MTLMRRVCRLGAAMELLLGILRLRADSTE